MHPACLQLVLKTKRRINTKFASQHKKKQIKVKLHHAERTQRESTHTGAVKLLASSKIIPKLVIKWLNTRLPDVVELKSCALLREAVGDISANISCLRRRAISATGRQYILAGSKGVKKCIQEYFITWSRYFALLWCPRFVTGK